MDTSRSLARACTSALASLLAAGTLVAVGGLDVAPAAAADSPTAQRSATGMTADALPTVQIDGVVWKQVVVANTVYAGGQFSNARPAGAAPGTSLTARGNLLAYDITTGNLITSFAPSLNGVVKAVAVSPDQKTLYVGGSFTTANGATHNRLAAYDVGTGAVVAGFNPSINAQVNAIAVTTTAVYVGGNFSTANGVARSKLAAVSPSTGATLGWPPSADAGINALLVTPDGSKVVAGGAFANVNGSSARGLAAIDATSGALVPWLANTVVQDYGASAAIVSLSTDGTQVYGTGYWYGGTGNFEGVVAMNPRTGAVNWLADCHGDTYDTAPVGGIVYSVSHHHNCDNIAGFGEQSPRQHWRANAFTSTATGTVRHNSQSGYADFYGYGSPSLVNWFPDLAAGSFTGQTQAAWTVTGTSTYLVLGGEFPSVNGTPQQGLVRFAVASKAPDKQGNRITAANSAPTLRSVSGTSVRVSYRTNWDRDDSSLTYQVRRSDKGATPVHTVTAQSLWWKPQTLVFIDTGLLPNTTYTYTIRENDPDNNVATSASTSVTTGTEVVDDTAYSRQVVTDGAIDYWRLDEKAGAAQSTDWAGANDLDLGAGVANGAAGAFSGSTDTAATFSGTSTGVAAESAAVTGPTSFSAEAWFKTTSTSGGKILGFGDTAAQTSSNYDRHVYLDDTGHLAFGVYPSAVKVVRGAKSYNDGQWHHVVASLSAAGQVLYVDGGQVAAATSVTGAQAYTGYWRIGGDNLSGWPGTGSSSSFAGTVDDVAIYPAALTAAQVLNHYSLAGRTSEAPARPTDAYGTAVFDDTPDLYWRLDETAGTTARDTTSNQSDGTYSGGVTLAAASTVAGTTGSAVGFNGSDASIGSRSESSGPTTFSEEVWFNTTTGSGGQLIGFGDRRSGSSGSVDRDLVMTSSGRLTFVGDTAQANAITTSEAYNDGHWHHAVTTQSAAGLRLYVDGVLRASGSQTGAQAPTGYWRVGGDSAAAGSGYLAGSIDEVAVYSYALTLSQVHAHYAASPAAVSTVNQLPTAAFTSSSTNLTVVFDGTGSHDPDGSVSTYAWTFGDGSTGTGAKPSHSYQGTGSYSVSLVVTDDDGDTSTAAVKRTLVGDSPLAADAFSRTASGWGSADTGGSWAVSPAARFATNGDVGTVSLTTAGGSGTATLTALSSADLDVVSDVSADRAATGGGTYVNYLLRKTSSGSYAVKLRLLADGSVHVATTRSVAGTETSIRDVAVSGLRYTPGDVLRVRVGVRGTSPTTLSAKVWRAGTAEPSTAQLTSTDTTAALQGAGGFAIQGYLSGSSTTLPVVLGLDNLLITAG